MPVASYETDPARYGRRFVVQTQNAAKPAYWVAFEYAVLAGTIGSLLYIAFGY